MKKIMFNSSNIRGTRSYWFAKGKELLAMVEQLGLPTLFITLSAADLHWPDLFKYLAPDKDVAILTDKERRKLIEENPMKVDTFFLERGETFINEVLYKKYKVSDCWFRIEYQHRGSPHIHGVFWLDDAPNVSNIHKFSDEQMKVTVEYFENLISTTHPNISCPPAAVHPCRKLLADVDDIKQDLAELLNRVQRHTKCSEGYCLRKHKRSGKIECRFKFPVELQELSKILISDENDVEFTTARNDPYLNKYNPYIVQTWRANIDVSPVLSKQALVNYLAKYICKSETQSGDLTELLKCIMDKTDVNTSAKQIIQRLYIQCCCERDYSAQETCHLLMGLKLYSSGGRKFVTINFNKLYDEEWLQVPEDGRRTGKTFIQKYENRSEKFEHHSLWDMAQNYDITKGSKYRKSAIVQVYPVILLKDQFHDNENYYKQQVLLHVPWRYYKDFLNTSNSWEEVFNLNIDVIRQSHAKQCRFQDVLPDDLEYEVENSSNNLPIEEWMSISNMGPSQNVQEVELGRRDIDVNFDWHKCFNYNERYGGIASLRSFITNSKESALVPSVLRSKTSITFTSEQESILKLLKLQICSIKDTNFVCDFSLPKTMLIQGRAGTGKSTVIHTMTSIIEEAFHYPAYVLLGPTGVSAININGATVHSKLHINFRTKEYTPLRGKASREFCKEFENIFFVIMDEYSMIGCDMLHIIENRLKEATGKENVEFGGLFVYLFGDIKQLNPPGDSPAYSDNQISQQRILGKLLYENIEGCGILSQVKRQANKRFQNLLKNISVGCVTSEDYNLLKSRFETSVSNETFKMFEDAIHLFPTNKEVKDFNLTKLRKLKDLVTNEPIPVASIPGVHNCPAAWKGSSNDAEGLEPFLFLAEGAKIMLRSNLWTSQGLVNGSMGHVINILYDESSNPPDDPPALLICYFESYKGPYLNDDDKSVVIERVTKTWTNASGANCSRSNFPVMLSYAASIHKSQGLSLNKVYVNIGDQEMSAGLTYTALSRSTSLDGLLLRPFSKSRLLGLNEKKYIQKRRDWEEELMKKVIVI